MRGKLDFRIGDARRPTSVSCSTPARSTSRRRRVWHGDSVFIGDDEYGECWILDVFAPPRADLRNGGLMARPADWRLAVDIGGTFTDVVLLDAATGRVVVDKTLTTPSAPLDGVRPGVAAAARQGRRAARPTSRRRSSTPRRSITNALIEGKTGRAGLVTTDGLRRHAAHPRRAPLRHVRPADRVPGAAGPARPHVRDRRAHAAAGRRGRRARAAPTLDALDRRSCAAAERRSRSACASSTPTPTPPTSGSSPTTCARELGVPVCISAEVSPQIREYPRMVTTACNAATMPVIGPYLDELQKWLAGRGLRRLGADDAVERRRRVGRRRGPRPDPPRRVRPGGGRARRQLVRPPPRRGPPAVLRHGRHDGQVVPHRATASRS